MVTANLDGSKNERIAQHAGKLTRLVRGRTTVGRSLEYLFLLIGFIAVVLFLVWRYFTGPYRWDFSVVPEYIPALWNGLILTLLLTVVCIILSTVWGVLIAVARMSSIPSLRILSSGYIEIMRTIPLLVVIVWSFYVLPIITGINFSPFVTGVIAITVYGGAVYAEAFRAGMQSVPLDQRECADLLGLSGWQKLRYVVLPQAIPNIIPVLVTCALLSFKETTLVAYVGIADLMRVGTLVSTTTFRPLEILTVVGLIYFGIGFPLTVIANKLETHLGKSQGRIIE